MFNGKDKLTFFGAGIFLFLGFFSLSFKAEAASLELAGKADWGNYGYIYFHCSDTHIGNLLNETENLSGAGKYLTPQTQDFHFTRNPCDLVYGVKISQGGVFSGNAWNPSLGLISFEYNGINTPPNYDFNVNCSGGANTCTTANNCIACYNFTDQKVYGWARIDYGSGDDWIKLDSVSPRQPVYIEADVDNPIWLLAPLELGDLGGTADVYGIDGNSPPYPSTISFHCLTKTYPAAPLDPYCSDHRVYVKNLIITNLTAPNWAQNSACTGSALKVILRWSRFGGTQKSYEILVSEESDFTAAQNNPICLFSKLSSATQHTIEGNQTTLDCPGGLAYDTAYYWWLRGQDNENNWTEWVQYENNMISDSDANRDGNTETFQTFKHEMPIPIFSYTTFPAPIQTNTSTEFTSTSLYYSPGSPSGPGTSCGANCSYLWSTANPLDSINATTSNPTIIIFESSGTPELVLRVTDPSGYVCSRSETLIVNYDLPLWREVKAQ